MPVHTQRHTVQKAHIFTTSVPEVPQNKEVWEWRSREQRVRTAILDGVHMAVDVDDSGAGHSAGGVQHGVQHTANKGNQPQTSPWVAAKEGYRRGPSIS